MLPNRVRIGLCQQASRCRHRLAPPIKPRAAAPTAAAHVLQQSTRSFAVAADGSSTPKAPKKQQPGALVELPTNESSPRLLALRHTAAHVMAMAVQRLFPQSQVTIGPWTEAGFFYDFFLPDGGAFTDADLVRIKKEMDSILKQDLPLVREVVSREEAKARIEALDEPYKLQILASITTEPVAPLINSIPTAACCRRSSICSPASRNTTAVTQKAPWLALLLCPCAW